MADQLRLSPDERANLVAYLDEELPPKEREALATKLAHSATARRELDALRTVWDMLDHLPLPSASPEMTERTITRVQSVVTHDEKLGTFFSVFGGTAVRVAVWAGAAAACFAVGFVLTRWAWPDETARLARRLTIAEYLEEYETVGSFQLLELLDKSPNF